MKQLGPIKEGDDSYAARKNIVVQLLDFFMNSLQGRLCIRAFPQQKNAGAYIIVVHHDSIFAMNRSPELPEPDLWPLRDNSNVLDPQGGAGLGQDHRVFNVSYISDQTYFANVKLLQTRLDKAAAGIGIVVGELLFHLREAQPVGNQFVGIYAHLIFAGRSAKTAHV